MNASLRLMLWLYIIECVYCFSGYAAQKFDNTKITSHFSQKILELEEITHKNSCSIESLETNLSEIENKQTEHYHSLTHRIQKIQKEQQAIEKRLQQLNTHVQAIQNEYDQKISVIITEVNKETGRMREQIAALAASRHNASSGKQHTQKNNNTDKTHTVQAGETLSAIAQSYGISSQTLCSANDLKDPNSIRIGQILIIPEGSSL